MVVLVVLDWVGAVHFVFVMVLVVGVEMSDMMLLFGCLPKNMCPPENLHLLKVPNLLLLYMYLDNLFHNPLNLSIFLILFFFVCLNSLNLLIVGYIV